MLEYWPLLLVGVFFAIMAVWRALALRGTREALEANLRTHGFVACPEELGALQEIVARIENSPECRYEIRDPKRLHGTPGVYAYVRVRHSLSSADSNVLPDEEDQLLLPLKRSSAGGLVLVVKPSSLEHGVATRLIGDVATADWDAQPDDLQRLELPADLRQSNLLGALGPPGATLDGLLDRRVLDVMLGLGDAGALVVRCRDNVCTVAGIGDHIPFKVGNVLERIRPLLLR